MFGTATKERIVAGFLALLGAGSFAWSLTVNGPPHFLLGEVLLAIFFAGAINLADRYPIHIQRGTKISLTNLPIFLLAVLLPAPLAISATGVGLLVSNLHARAERGLLPRDILSTLGQWMFITFLGNWVSHLSLPGTGNILRDGLLIPSALTFLLGDFLVFSLSQSVLLGEPFISLLKSIIKEGIALELTQYSIAVLGAMAAYENKWSLFLLILPIVITYVAFKNLKETRFETIQILENMADTVDLRDVYTGGHSKRVADYVSRILARLDISGPEATLIEIAARLHDIGKIGIPDSILQKPGKLLPEEMAVMQTHSEEGAELISKYKDFARGAQIIQYHHERWDGKGYPAGLRAHEIPFGSRVIAVADSFDAMTSDRPYRKALSTKQALQILLEEQGKQWDAKIVSAFVELIAEQTTVEKGADMEAMGDDIAQAVPQKTLSPQPH